MSYKGWTNKETWLVNLWLDQYIASEVHDNNEVTARGLQDAVDSMMESANICHLGLFKDLIAGALDRVDWEEIADSAKELEGY